jgi:RsmE family RNA methyltransferase
MNLVLVEPDELDGARATVRGRRARHIALVHRAEVGATLRAGVVGGDVGTADVVASSTDQVVLDLQLAGPPPPPLACTLVLALPRPKVLRRVLGAVAAFGIKRVALVGAQRVEKSYWQSPALAEDAVRGELLLGLEQARDTVVPVVTMHRRFRPFVEDELAKLAAGTLAVVADASADTACPRADGRPVTLVVGPEGGFIPFELGLLREAGMQAVSLGARTLRVEHALAALIGRMF